MNRPLSVSYLLGRLRLRQVALLLEVRNLGTLRAAASQLAMTQPAATNMLKELESTLGVRLFEREGRGLRMTTAGATVTAYFDGIGGVMSALGRDVESLREGDGGTLAIGSILAPSPTLLTRTVTRIKQEQPRLRLTLLTETSDHLLELLDKGTLDLVIGRISEGHAHCDHISKLLEGEALSVVVGPANPIAKRRRLAVSDLIGEPWVLQPRGSPMRELLEREFRLHGLDRPADLVETSSIMTTIFLIGEAKMVAVVPTSVATPYAAKAMLSVLPIRLASGLEPYGSIVRRGRPLSAAAERFLEMLHDSVPAALKRRPRPLLSKMRQLGGSPVLQRSGEPHEIFE